jgi:hypothetical protein
MQTIGALFTENGLLQDPHVEQKDIMNLSPNVSCLALYPNARKLEGQKQFTDVLYHSYLSQRSASLRSFPTSYTLKTCFVHE